MREALDLGDRRFLALAADGDGALVPGRVAVGIATPARSTLALPNTDCPSACGPTPASAQCLRSASPPGAWSFGQSTGCPCPLEVAVPRSTHYRVSRKAALGAPDERTPGCRPKRHSETPPSRDGRACQPLLVKGRSDATSPNARSPRPSVVALPQIVARARDLWGDAEDPGIVRSRARPAPASAIRPRPPRPRRCA